MKTAIIKTSFTSGEVSGDLFGRGDLQSYQNGAKCLLNVNILRGGGVIRRSGSRYLDRLHSKGRMEKIKKDGVEYLCIFTDKKISLYKQKILLTTIDSPWAVEDLMQLHFAMNKGRLIVCSGKYPVKEVVDSNGTWSLQNKALIGLPTNTFSDILGYPICSGFIQGRFVLAGTTSYPNRIWFSKSGSHTDFSLGQGLADDGIDIQLLSGEEERITGIFSAKNLIVFTNSGEWVVEGKPITPNQIIARRHGRVGSFSDFSIKPIDADGDIFFIPRQRSSIFVVRQEAMADGYKSENAIGLSKHLVRDIITMNYSAKHNRMFCVKEDGTMAVMTYDKSEGVMAWTNYDTQGRYIDVCAMNDVVYTIVLRDNGYILECFDKNTLMDATAFLDKGVKKDLSFLNNHVVGVVGDGIVRANATVLDNDVALPDASHLMIGMRYQHIIESLPFETENSGRSIRLRKVTLRLQNTASLNINVGRGTQPLPFKKFGTGILNTAVPLFTGDKHITTLGWRKVDEQSLYKIAGDDPLPVSVLSIKADVSINT